MEKKYIVYHLTPLNDYKPRFKKAYDLIAKELLNQVETMYIVLNGDVDLSILPRHSKVTCIKLSDHMHPNECLTINFIKQFSYSNAGSVLYLHCKGITKPDNKCINDWVDMMSYFLIEKYQDCLDKLKEYYTVGVNKGGENYTGLHYSGNFWWSNLIHIKDNLEFIHNVNDKNAAELWLLSRGNKNKFYSMHNSDVTGHHNDRYPPEKYK